jgi:hypothetical protein
MDGVDRKIGFVLVSVQLCKILCHSSQLVSGFLLQRHHFIPRVLHVWFVVGSVALGDVFLQAPKIFVASYYCGTALW